jgi:hypothetical protein
MAGVNISIDRIPLEEQLVPWAMDIVPAGYSEHPLPGGGMVVFEELTPCTIILRMGDGGMTEVGQYAMETLRTRAAGLHLLGFEDLSCNRISYVNVYIPRAPRNTMQHIDGQHLAFGNYELVCKQLNLWPKLVCAEFSRKTVTVMDGAYKYYPPAPGRIIAVDGWIEDSGSGGGQTRIQLSQSGIDFLATEGDFAAGGAGVVMTNQVLSAITSFVKGIPMELDIDTQPGNSDANDMHVNVWLMLFTPV